MAFKRNSKHAIGMEKKSTKDLRRFLGIHGSSGEILAFDGSVHSVEGAAKNLGTDPSAAIKTLVFISDDKNVVAAIVPGERKGDRKKIEDVAGIGKLHFASPDEALELTGYAVGGTPPVDNNATIVIIDPKVAKRDYDSFGGGGDDRHLLKISSGELLRLNPGAKIADASREGS